MCREVLFTFDWQVLMNMYVIMTVGTVILVSLFADNLLPYLYIYIYQSLNKHVIAIWLTGVDNGGRVYRDSGGCGYSGVAVCRQPSAIFVHQVRPHQGRDQGARFVDW